MKDLTYEIRVLCDNYGDMIAKDEYNNTYEIEISDGDKCDLMEGIAAAIREGNEIKFINCLD